MGSSEPVFREADLGSVVRDNSGKSSGEPANEMPRDRRVLYDTDSAVTAG